MLHRPRLLRSAAKASIDSDVVLLDFCAGCERSIAGENPVRPVWRAGRVALPYALCAQCCLHLVDLLDADMDDAIRFTRDLEIKALLAHCPAGGTDYLEENRIPKPLRSVLFCLHTKRATQRSPIGVSNGVINRAIFLINITKTGE
jgi:hypothetical protein